MTPDRAIAHAVASLAAAISLLEKTPQAKKAAPSDRMFDQMLDDYRKALNEARATLSAPSALENSPAGLADAHSKSPSRPAMPKEEDTHG